MERGPLNLAHFHERRAERFIRHNRYDDAKKAVQASLLYLQDAYKVLTIPKSIEVLNTQKWDYERKLKQIQIRKEQYERLKLKEIVPPLYSDVSCSSVARSESGVTPQSASKSIDKTIEEVFSMTEHIRRYDLANGIPPTISSPRRGSRASSLSELENEFPSLVPLELPTFDFDVFTTSTLSLNSIASLASLAESFQK